LSRSFLYRYFERRALNALVSGQYEKAETYFLTLIQRWGSHPGLAHNVALAQFALKKYDQAETNFLAELEAYGETEERLKALGDLYFAWGRREDAQKRYAEALRLAQEADPPSRPPEAEIRFLQKRISLCSHDDRFSQAQGSLALLDRGNSLLAEGRWDEAYAAFEAAVAADPTCYPALNNLGYIALNHRRAYADAAARFRSAAALSPLPTVRQNLLLAEQLGSKTAT